LEIKTEQEVDPDNFRAYMNASRVFQLNGVSRPFYLQWWGAEPHIFLTPEPLHHWDKFTWDHLVKWCIAVVGADEFDFRYMVLNHHKGERSFNDGLSSLKQVTGKVHRELQRHLVPVIAGAASKEFTMAIRALVDFQYLGRAPVVDDDQLLRMDACLQEFHKHKEVIINEGGRSVEGWMIPKLEFFQSVVSNIRLNGVCGQWSAQATEHEHIKVIKDPARASNNKGYEEQICRYLDRKEKTRKFDVATAIEHHMKETGQNSRDPGAVARISPEDLPTVSPLLPGRDITDYFQLAEKARDKDDVGYTFQNAVSAFHLDTRAKTNQISISEASRIYRLSDLAMALQEYVLAVTAPGSSGFISTIGVPRRRPVPGQLYFKKVHFWYQMRMQTREYHAPHALMEGRLVKAFPPLGNDSFAECDAVMLKTDATVDWPDPSLKGKRVLVRTTT